MKRKYKGKERHSALNGYLREVWISIFRSIGILAGMNLQIRPELIVPSFF